MIMQPITISDKEFFKFQKLMFDEAGVSLADGKRSLVAGRLMKRLKHYGLKSYDHYFSLVDGRGCEDERQVTIDLLTTHETYFFREDAHFTFMQETINKHFQGKPLRVWSAACSTGQEPYSIAMTLSELRSESSSWGVFASDISQSSLMTAARGLYTEKQVQSLSQQYLAKYCLKGVRSQQGRYTVTRDLRKKVEFRQVNLNENLSRVGKFDFIFLRNVMIYFDMETKRRVVDNLVKQLNRGGFLLIGHSETLNSINDDLTYIRPSIYTLS